MSLPGEVWTVWILLDNLQGFLYHPPGFFGEHRGFYDLCLMDTLFFISPMGDLVDIVSDC